MNNINITVLAPYITFITAIFVAYLTYQSQLRLKSFELLLKRREEVLHDMEKAIEKFYLIRYELLSPDESQKQTWEKYSRDFYHENIVLYHKIKGANFGKTSFSLLEKFYQVTFEAAYIRSRTEEGALKWIQSLLTLLTTLYGYAHSNVNKEIETISLPLYKRIARYSKQAYRGFRYKWARFLWLRFRINSISKRRNYKRKETNF
ncbi:hypothetical protein [Peribacillus simplex]|uniref:DUF4760 domain-containing protein n=1 Tax=Peribacillus simplex TaxID=1478 RepID=A0A9W4PD64_9BACI|nr:hypothetical protein [Peribacillus simplex]CAH0186672.1 hypothetical protein SRABI133_01562 [Peribacillus simplex]